MAKKFNVAIIGYGWVATAHIEAINKTGTAQVTAIYSSRHLDEKALSIESGSQVRVYTDLDEMLGEPDIDVVSICSYPYQHKEQAVKAARAGKNLILEKPLALSWADCKEVESVVKETGVKACVCFECRFSNQFQVTKSLLDQGLLGDLHYGEIDYYHGIGPWYGQYRWNIRKEAGGSSLLSAGCHALDALLWCMHDEVAEVTSYESRSSNPDFAPYEYNTSSVTILKFRNGAIGKCASSIDCLQPYYFHTHLCGSRGSILDDKFHTEVLKTDKGTWSELAMKLLDSGDVSDHPYQVQFETFFRSILENEVMPLTGLTEAMKTFEVVFAADQSAREGVAVQL